MDKKTFKMTFKFVCNECGEFAYTNLEYCEKCGEKALRKATNEDYTRYEMETIRDAKEHRIVFEKADETRKVTERAENVVKKARMVAEKAEKAVKQAAEKAKRKAEKIKQAAEKAKEEAEKAKKKVERTKQEAKAKAEKS